MKPNIRLIFLTLLVYGIPIFILSSLPFSKNFYGTFQSPIFSFLFYGKILYSSLGIIFDLLLAYCAYLLFKKNIDIEKERVYLIYTGIKKIIAYIFVDDLQKEFKASKEEKVSLLFYLVKIFWTPVMLNFAIGNTNALINIFSAVSKADSLQITKISVLKYYFPFIFYLILIIDTFIFSFGYLFESAKLKNIVKSVEPTALGWLVTIIWYPPINEYLTGRVVGWYSSDFSDFGSININIITGLISLSLFLIYVWASIALGFKASNLTNRGIVSHGPYKYVRHPAYITKNLSWWLMAIPFIKINGFVAVLSMTIITFFYFLRALTEERHLSQDPEYVEYAKKVKYMFIPGLI